MNSTPADSKALRIAKLLAAVIEVSSIANSARRIVVSPTDEDRASPPRSSGLALLLRGFERSSAIFSLNYSFHMVCFIPYRMENIESFQPSLRRRP
jgi:hypothetical protein